MSLFLALSKLFTVFLSPFTWILLLLVCAKWVKSKLLTKRLLISAVILFLVFSNEFLLTKFVVAWQPAPVELTGSSYSAGVVLGGFSTYDKYGRGYFNSASDRFIQASKLYHSGIIKKVVVSGGSLWNNQPSEASFVSKQLIASGIPATDIISELSSRNTYENAVFTKRILDSLHMPQPVLLITSAMHLQRATSLFEKVGMKVKGYPCDYRVVDRKMHIDDFILPKIQILDKWSMVIKELAGLAMYKVAGKA